jgi:hypothetical protein
VASRGCDLFSFPHTADEWNVLARPPYRHIPACFCRFAADAERVTLPDEPSSPRGRRRARGFAVLLAGRAVVNLIRIPFEFPLQREFLPGLIHAMPSSRCHLTRRREVLQAPNRQSGVHVLPNERIPFVEYFIIGAEKPRLLGSYKSVSLLNRL